MGFLTEGRALSWAEAAEKAEYVRDHGIEQLLAIYHKVKDRKNDSFKWGDEVEYILLSVDEKGETTRLCLRGAEILHVLQEPERRDASTAETLWRPEYGAFMVEGTPGQPYTSSCPQFRRVEPNMKLRRQQVEALLKPNERILSITSYPMMGVGDFTDPPPVDWTPGSGQYARSIFIPDEIINPHERFRMLSKNIRERKGSTVDINIPLFHDNDTKPPQYGTEPCCSASACEPPAGAKPDHIYMDAMAFGMGCCCLQCTFQCCNINEARLFYDQLAVLTPILMALSAAAPIYRGYLADTDVRWNVISSSVDDRTEEERGTKALKNQPRTIPKSRYASISLYIGPEESSLKDEFNDIEVPYNEKVFERLLSEGLDSRLAKHFAHLFIRDPLVIYDNRIEIDDQTASDHFENIQSTNWQTVRFKPPPPNSDIGWRVEFRSMEASLTDFENAAFSIFTVLLSRIISAYELNFYIPISLVDENMARAHKRDAVLKEKFHFRTDPSAGGDDGRGEYTINEIMNGRDGGFPGLIPLINVYLDTRIIDDDARAMVQGYLDLLGKRASGELKTTAAWMREFVTEHPDYKHDSVVSHKISHDLLQACHEITQGSLHVPGFLP